MNTNRGNITLLGLTLLMLVGGTLYLYATLDLGTKANFDAETRLGADVLSHDVIEMGKYLLVYEKLIYADAKGPMDLSGTRGADLRKLWGESLGIGSSASGTLMDLCGGYDAMGTRVGTYRLGSTAVFCPLLLRNHVMDSAMLESMVLEPMALANRLKKNSDGSYSFTLTFYDKDAGVDNLSNANGTLLHYASGQQLFKSIGAALRKVTLEVRIMGVTAGYSADTAERFIRLKASVELGGTVQAALAEKTESVLMYPSSPRDFALFILFPTKADGETPTRLFSESVVLPAGSVIQGRVFFNGDIDVPLDNLPNFEEMVVITGDLVPALRPADLAKFRAKFKKGLIAHYSAPRNLFTGNCSQSDPAQAVVNYSGFFCKKGNVPFNIVHYIAAIPHQCTFAPLTAKERSSDVNCADSTSSCENDCKVPMPVVRGPIRKASFRGVYNLVSAPIAELSVESDFVYGVVLGGHVRATKKVTWKAFSALSTSDVGIGSADVLASDLGNAAQAGEGVSSPLSNLPIVSGGKAD